MGSSLGQLPPAFAARFQVQRVLGRGGFGEVLLAEDLELNRPVALKSMHPGGDPSDQERFLREARALARLDHPGVVRMLDFLEGDGVHLLVLEYVPGRSLEGEVLDADELEALARTLTDALAAVHELGMLHRDVKPANLLRDELGAVRLSDFGLVFDPKKTQLTGTGKLAGTLAYFSPEVIQGGGYSAASDFWALGVTLFELAEGELPFRFAQLFELEETKGREDFFRPKFENLDPDSKIATLIRAWLEVEPGRRPVDRESVEWILSGLRSPTEVLSSASSSVSKAAPESGWVGKLPGGKTRSWVLGLGVLGLLAGWFAPGGPSAPGPLGEVGTAGPAKAPSLPSDRELAEAFREELSLAIKTFRGPVLDPEGTRLPPEERFAEGATPLVRKDPFAFGILLNDLASWPRLVRAAYTHGLSEEAQAVLREFDDFLALRGQTQLSPLFRQEPLGEDPFEVRVVKNLSNFVPNFSPVATPLHRSLTEYRKALQLFYGLSQRHEELGERSESLFGTGFEFGFGNYFSLPETIRTFALRPQHRPRVAEVMNPVTERLWKSNLSLGVGTTSPSPEVASLGVLLSLYLSPTMLGYFPLQWRFAEFATVFGRPSRGNFADRILDFDLAWQKGRMRFGMTPDLASRLEPRLAELKSKAPQAGPEAESLLRDAVALLDLRLARETKEGSQIGPRLEAYLQAGLLRETGSLLGCRLVLEQFTLGARDLEGTRISEASLDRIEAWIDRVEAQPKRASWKWLRGDLERIRRERMIPN